MAEKPRGLTYAQAGVDIDAGNRMVDLIKPLVRATARPGADAEIGGFGGLFDLKRVGYRDPILVAATDGVGTKLKIAIDTGRHDTIGIDLVAMSVNDLVVQGAEPLFFLDYYACGKLEPEVGAAVVAGISLGCREAGCALIGGETAEMPGVYQGDDYDLAGFAVGVVERDGVLPRGDIVEGDIILGLASTGVHSNGYSLVRKVVEKTGLSWTAPAPFTPGQSSRRSDPHADADLREVVSCARSAAPKPSKVSRTLPAAAFPTTFRAYCPMDLAQASISRRCRCRPIFQWLASEGGIAEHEMLRTFNCGIGMIVVVSPKDADSVAQAFTRAGETAVTLGKIIKASGDTRVIYDGKLKLR